MAIKKNEVTTNLKINKSLLPSKKYEKKVANYKLTTNNYQTFRNIQILFCGKEWVMISKNDNPTIHFIITHPKLSL